MDEMTTYPVMPPEPGLLPYRIGQLESFRRDFEDWRRHVDDDRQALLYVINDLKILKRIGVSLLLSIVTGSTAITVAIWIATRRS